MNQQQWHPSQWASLHQAYWSAQCGSWACIVAALGLIGATASVRDPIAKLATSSGVLAACAIATPQRRTVRRLEGMIRDIQDLSDASFQQFVWGKLSPITATIATLGTATIEPKPDPERFYEFDSILDETTGIAILGNSGSGKSCVVQYILGLMGQTQVLVCDPHDDSRTWGSLHVISSYEAIAAQLELLLAELDTRREKRKRGENLTPIAIVADEWPSIRLYCSQQGLDVADRFLLRMGSECRKYAMLTLFCSQSGNTKALGMEGKGDFLENFTLIRLGKVARKYAKNLTDRSVLSHLKTVAYGCLVDDAIAVHPTHGHYSEVKKNQPPANLQPLRSLPLTIQLTDVVPNSPPVFHASAFGVFGDESEDFEESDREDRLLSLIELSQKKGWLSATIVKQNSRLFKDVSPDEIRLDFVELNNRKLGATRHTDKRLEWHFSPPPLDSV